LTINQNTNKICIEYSDDKLARLLHNLSLDNIIRFSSVFADNLLSDSVMQNFLFSFWCQFVWLCTQTLLAKHEFIADDIDDTNDTEDIWALYFFSSLQIE